MKKAVLWIDGDIFIHRASVAVEVEQDWGDDLWSLTADARSAKQLVDAAFNKLMLRYETENVHVALSHSPSWRCNIWPTYKSNRAKVRKPVCYRAVREYVIETYKGIQLPGMEADDLLGIAATRPGGGDVVIVSPDKDLKGVPCRLYNPDTDEEVRISRKSADTFHALQTLMGDTSDGYPGCPGIGPVKAASTLDRPGNRWGNIVETYEAAGLTEKDALVQARVARITQWDNWDDKRKVVIPWKP